MLYRSFIGASTGFPAVHRSEKKCVQKAAIVPRHAAGPPIGRTCLLNAEFIGTVPPPPPLFFLKPQVHKERNT